MPHACTADNGREGHLTFDGVAYPVSVLDLPTVVESYKTYDDVNLVKTADVGRILLVRQPGSQPPQTHESPHGLTPPMQFAKQRHFFPHGEVDPELVAKVSPGEGGICIDLPRTKSTTRRLPGGYPCCIGAGANTSKYTSDCCSCIEILRGVLLLVFCRDVRCTGKSPLPLAGCIQNYRGLSCPVAFLQRNASRAMHRLSLASIIEQLHGHSLLLTLSLLGLWVNSLHGLSPPPFAPAPP